MAWYFILLPKMALIYVFYLGTCFHVEPVTLTEQPTFIGLRAYPFVIHGRNVRETPVKI
jgi:hypothetical protein